MQCAGSPDPCCCAPIPVPSCPPPCPPPQTVCPSKYYRQIGAEMIGNQLIITMEKDKCKAKRKFDQWDPPCDCDTIEIQRPTSREGPKLLKGAKDNRILFRIQSKSNIKDETAYKPQAVAYQLGSCKGGLNTNDQCRNFTIYPQLGVEGAQEVHSDNIREGNENIFLLRIKKKPDGVQKFKRNVELELRTPRPPTPPINPPTVDFRPNAQVEKLPTKQPIADEPKRESKKRRRRRK